MSGELVDRVRDRLIGAGDRPTPEALASAVRAESGGLLAETEVLSDVRMVQRELSGAGILEPLLDDPAITDVLVTAPDEVWVDRGNGVQRAELGFPDEESVRRLAQRLAVASGRRLDDAQPWTDAWLPAPGGTRAVRLHAVLPPVSARGTCICLRVLRRAANDLDALSRGGAFGADLAEVLREVVRCGLAFLVVGGTASGKTTLLAAMLGAVPAHERIVCVEEAAELHPEHPHFVRLLTRPPNVEGTGEIGVADLVRQALRMRPDRLIVGEVRGPEVRELLGALNTGHDGGGGTLHANHAAEVPARMEALAAAAGLSRAALHSQLAAGVQVVLHVRRITTGRVLAGIGVLGRVDGLVVVRDAWSAERGWEPAGRARLAAELAARGGALPC